MPVKCDVPVKEDAVVFMFRTNIQLLRLAPMSAVDLSDVV